FFNLINTSATFQTYINHALYKLVDNFCIIYLNNILIFFRTKVEYLYHFKYMIKHLHHIKLYINLKKCKFFKFKVKYLGFIINKKGIQMNPAHIKIISKWPRP